MSAPATCTNCSCGPNCRCAPGACACPKTAAPISTYGAYRPSIVGARAGAYPIAPRVYGRRDEFDYPYGGRRRSRSRSRSRRGRRGSRRSRRSRSRSRRANY